MNKLEIVKSVMFLFVVALSAWSLIVLQGLSSSVDRNTQAVTDLHGALTEFPENTPVSHALSVDDESDAGVVDSMVLQNSHGAVDVSVSVVIVKEE